jgi:crossover junction endodeoxyribonuclease RuvC
MRIIAIDPGYDRCGVALLEGETTPKVLFSCCATSTKTATQETRLSQIYTQLFNIINEWKPQFLALETLFFSVNKKTAIKVAEARGMILTLAGNTSLPVIELSPQAIKIAMTGVGNATKEQVQKMVALTTTIDLSKKHDDEIDAIALGGAALQMIRVENLKKGLAKKK